MKTKKFKYGILLFFIVIYCVNLSADDSYIKKRLTIKAGYTGILTGYKYTGTNKEKIITPVYNIEVDYGILNFIETGLYLGTGKFELVGLKPGDSIYNITKNFVTFYGIQTQFQLLPVFIKTTDFRFDLYLKAKLGGQYYSTPKYYMSHGNYFEYGFGGGISFYIWRNLGIYSEYLFYDSNYFRIDKTRFTTGINFKFKLVRNTH